MALDVIDGGAGSPAEPDWNEAFPGKAKSVIADRARASGYWHAVIAELRDTSKLAAVNAHQIKRLVVAYVMHDRAAVAVARLGAVVKAPRTGVLSHNPWWTVLNNADSAASAIEAELTLSPRRRGAGTKVEKKVRRATGADRYLKSVGS